MRSAALTQRAKDMRKAMPEPEKRLWMELRAGRFQGIKFRRQKVIGSHIADFAANDPKVIIEVDGDTHAEREACDVARTKSLEDHGYSVIRFSNFDVMGNMDGVLLQLSEFVAGLRASAPPPTPSPYGEGAEQ